MIHQHHLIEKNNLQILKTFQTLKISKLLRDANIRKSEGFSASYLFKLAVEFFQGLNNQSRVKVLIVDDSLFSRNRSKKVEFLARIFDHVSGKKVKQIDYVEAL